MTFTVSAVDTGTPESEWLPALASRGTPVVDWGDAGRVVVIAPHPDDETLGAGGTLRALARRGFDVHVVAVTDGEASHPASGWAPGALAARRASEQSRALERLGLADVRVTRLGLPDGRVEATAELVDVLVQALRGAAWCLAPWEHDGHPDHDAVGHAARVAAALERVPLAAYPVWAWHWSWPGDPRWPWPTLCTSPLTASDVAAKRHAIGAFESQLRVFGSPIARDPVLPPGVVARFHRPFEVFFR